MEKVYQNHKKQTIAEDARHSKESYKIFNEREKAEDAVDKKYDAEIYQLLELQKEAALRLYKKK